MTSSSTFSWWDSGTSQALLDPFSFVHCGAGFFSRWVTGWDTLSLTQVHQLWEMFENSPWGVSLLNPQRFKMIMPCLNYFHLAWDDYKGDSALNSASDAFLFLVWIWLMRQSAT